MVDFACDTWVFDVWEVQLKKTWGKVGFWIETEGSFLLQNFPGYPREKMDRFLAVFMIFGLDYLC